MNLCRFLIISFLAIFSATSFASQVYKKGFHGKNIVIEGYISDVPKFYSSADGKYQSYSFRVNAASSHRHGDEFIMISFKTVKWGKRVGDFSGKKGDKISLVGKYSEFKGPQKSGIVGSLAVNDKSYKEVNP